ncbi:aspartate kinase [Flavobacteriaceae bacterium S356]|uniref:Aspartokinase n=1 Tax=Asprobacillus argus TaxID=3076534 RepID=A0ABU3LE44_9FLAO|nr:aspartate kinase [Flavobacteriaceae bacterium S356]
MIVLKFGGTSVGSAESIKKVVDVITSTSGKKIVVFSAFSGVTNLLVHINACNKIQDPVTISETLNMLEIKCRTIISNLFKLHSYKQIALNFIDFKIKEIASYAQETYSEKNTKLIVAQGEIISTHIIQFYLQERKISSTLISALDFMEIDHNEEPVPSKIATFLSPQIYSESSSDLFITQGFICKKLNQVDNLKRGGSDYTASLIGAALDVDEIQIWTDIDGMHNNDPRFVENTFSIEEISFDEAAELAYFGAKILHPQSLIPAKEKNIPVRLKNTFNAAQKGTVIKNDAITNGVTSIAAKDGITAIKIKSFRMLLAYGFLKKVFEVFETYKTPIDMITTSEVAVSLTIDEDANLKKITNALTEFGTVEVDTGLSIVCVAGDFSQNKEGISAEVFNSLKDIPIRMISYGGSNYNISLLVKTSDKKRALNALNRGLFSKKVTLEIV